MYCKEESDKSMKCLPLQCAAKKAFNPTAKTCVGKILQLGEIHSNTNTYLPVYKWKIAFALYIFVNSSICQNPRALAMRIRQLVTNEQI